MITYDTYGWVRSDDTKHFLQVWRDGTALADDRAGVSRAQWGHITSAEVSMLLDYLLNEQQLSEFSQAAIDSARRAVDASLREAANASLIGPHTRPLLFRAYMVHDGATRRIRINDGRRLVDASCYECEYKSVGYPQVRQYAQFTAAADWLQVLRSRVIIGDPVVFDEFLASANERLRQDRPDSHPFTREHLWDADRFVKNSSLRLIFRHREWTHPDTVRTTEAWVLGHPGRPLEVEIRTMRSFRQPSQTESILMQLR